jgi:hypothetical protein
MQGESILIESDLNGKGRDTEQTKIKREFQKDVVKPESIFRKTVLRIAIQQRRPITGRGASDFPRSDTFL